MPFDKEEIWIEYLLNLIVVWSRQTMWISYYIVVMLCDQFITKYILKILYIQLDLGIIVRKLDEFYQYIPIILRKNYLFIVWKMCKWFITQKIVPNCMWTSLFVTQM